jgi:hypothetical protein
MLEFVTEYWRETIAVVVFLGMFVAPKAVEPLKKLLSVVNSKLVTNPRKITVEEQQCMEVVDQEAIRHLRQRALEFGDDELLKNLRIIDAKFYDAHCASDCASTNAAG